MSALTGFLLGLVVAWFAWSESRPPTRSTPAGSPPMASLAPGTSPAPDVPELAGPPVDAAVVPRGELPREAVDPAKAIAVDGKMVQDLGDGRRILYTLSPAIQQRARKILQAAEVPFGALVALDPHTGNVLGYVEHSSADAGLKHLAGRANPPAASVFKLITTTALIETAGITPETQTCFHGGARGISRRNMLDDTKLDTRCQTLTDALARSTNAVYGKLAYKHLTGEVLRHYARAFRWDADIPFVLPVEPSRATVTDDRVQLGQTAAGFYNTHLSPIHAALVAATIANGGLMMAPRLVDALEVDGRRRAQPRPEPLGRACREQTAKVLAHMMVATTERGTAGAYFRKRGRSLKGIDVAAKTGSLSVRPGEADNRYHFSWWVGFAPAENPRIALAAMVVNNGEWRIKSTYLAREVLEAYFAEVGGAEISRAATP